MIKNNNFNNTNKVFIPTPVGEVDLKDIADFQLSNIYYVDITKSNNDGDGLTPATAFKNIQFAIDNLKKHLLGDVTICIMQGDYSAEGQIKIQGFIGYGSILVRAFNGVDYVLDNSQAINYKIDSVIVDSCRNKSVLISCLNGTYAGTDREAFLAYESATVVFQYCTDTVISSRTAFSFSQGTAGQCSNCLASNKNVVLLVSYNSHVNCGDWTAGTNNVTGLRTISGVIMKYNASQPFGTTMELSVYGGVIR